MQLNYKVSGSGFPFIILHGLFGMLDNWRSFAKYFEHDFTMYLIDQRNHGKSPHTADISYPVLANDVYEFMQQQNILSAHILGHSMGGKTAMQFALKHPQKVNKLIVVDMGIKKYPEGHEDIFDALFAIDLSQIHYRSDAEKILLDKISDFSTRQFVLKNLTRNADGSYTWKFNLQALKNNYANYILAPVASDHSYNGKTLFVRSKNSGYIKDEDWNTIQKLFPNAELITINSGHWIHADKPAELEKAVHNFLK